MFYIIGLEPGNYLQGLGQEGTGSDIMNRSLSITASLRFSWSWSAIRIKHHQTKRSKSNNWRCAYFPLWWARSQLFSFSTSFRRLCNQNIIQIYKIYSILHPLHELMDVTHISPLLFLQKLRPHRLLWRKQCWDDPLCIASAAWSYQLAQTMDSCNAEAETIAIVFRRLLIVSSPNIFHGTHLGK